MNYNLIFDIIIQRLCEVILKDYISLDGEWLFRNSSDDDCKWLNGTVPGCNYLDLLRLEKITDPFIGNNEKDCYWVAEKDWEYKKSFDVTSAQLSSDKIYLDCTQLDTICKVYINDIHVGVAENCHISYSFDIKSQLQIGENIVKIMFSSPINYVKNAQKNTKCPNNANGQTGIPNIRKPQCHFGWDWGPVLPPSGISGKIGINFYNYAKINDFLVKQEHINKEKVELNISFNAELYKDIALDYEVNIKTPSNEIIHRTATLETNNFLKIDINNPELWWTKELSNKTKQPLYVVTITIIYDKKVVDTKSKKIGLRTIELNQNKDKYGQNFQFILNGVPIFAKGANYIPADSFITRYSAEKLKKDISACLFSNFNMIRIWGGGYYASDDFYDICDEVGLLIWQDYMFSCQPYPFFEEKFLENVLNEVGLVTKRICHHPSLAILAGNNEIEVMSPAWMNRRKFIDWTDKFFHNILPNKIIDMDINIPFIPGSPCGISHLNGVSSDNVGDTHLWAVWHGLQPLDYYRKRNTRFCSEFGFESLPDIKTINIFAEENDYSLDSKVFKNHQKCLSGNYKMIYYIASKFFLPKDFLDFVYMSQITQIECIKDATEHWRRNKGQCNGALYWQLNDCWPVCSWSSIDYYGNYKGLQYQARHFNNPTMVSIAEKNGLLKIHIINDLLDTFSAECSYTIIDFYGEIISSEEKSFTLVPNKNLVAYDLKINDIIKPNLMKNSFLVSFLKINGKVVSRKTHLFYPENKLKLPSDNLIYTTEIIDDVAIIKITSKSFHRYIEVFSSEFSAPFSDNYFDLLPDETIIVKQSVPLGTSTKIYNESLQLKSLTKIKPKNSRIMDKLMMLKIFLKPANFFPYLYYKKIPKKTKV